MTMISYAQNLEDVMLMRALQHVSNGFYIDVGANDPFRDSVTQAFYERGWTGINIEPLPAQFTALQTHRQRDANLQCALGETSGSLKLWDCGVDGWATADQQTILRHQSQGQQGEYIEVPVHTLAEICRTHVVGDVHFLKIDVEGHEEAVLKGADFSTFRPWIVVCEATMPNSQIPVFAQWEPLLLNNRYQMAYADGLNRFYVAQERSDLLAKLQYPPNCFDGYTRIGDAFNAEQAKHWQRIAEQEASLRETAQGKLRDLAATSMSSQARRRLLVNTLGSPANARFGGNNRMVNAIMEQWLCATNTQGSLYEIIPIVNTATNNYEIDTSFEHLSQGRGYCNGETSITVQAGDTILFFPCFFLYAQLQPDYFDLLRRQGVRSVAVILDFLPIHYPQHFPAQIATGAHNIVSTIFKMDAAICISEKVARELTHLIQANNITMPANYNIAWSHLGADFIARTQTPLTRAEDSLLSAVSKKPYFLMVSSLEPRKGYRQALKAFEQLWQEGSDLNLVIMGKNLWLMDDFVQILTTHPEAGKRLHWVNGGSDALLHALYVNARCLFAPNDDEGYGLPIVEAARLGVPLLLHDIDIFREITQGKGYFFSSNAPDHLVTVIKEWLALYAQEQHPTSREILTHTWENCARNFLALAMNPRTVRGSAPDSTPPNTLNTVEQKLSPQIESLKTDLRQEIATKWQWMDALAAAVAPSPALVCPLCGHHDERVNFRVLDTTCAFGGGHLHRYVCPHCQVIFGSEKMLRLSADQLSQEYNHHYQVYQEGDSTDSEVRAFFALEPRKEGRYLNFGAGAWSHSVPYLRNLGWDVWAYEPHSSASPEDPAHAFTLSHDGVQAQRFDGIFTNNVLEHFREPVAELRSINALLKPGGHVAHATPCYEYRYEYTRFHLFFFQGRSRSYLWNAAGMQEISFTQDGDFMCAVCRPS